MSDAAAEAGRRGVALVAAERFELAIPLLRDGLASSPQDPKLLNHLSYALLRTGDHVEALELAERSVAVEPSNEWSHRLRALALNRMGRAKRALAAAEEARRLAPEQWIVHTTLAEMQANMGHLQEAEASARKAVRVAPNAPGPHLQLASVLLEQQRLLEARTCAERALRIDPTSAVARNVLGVLDRAERGEPSARQHFLAAAAGDLRLDAPRANLAHSMLYGGARSIVVWTLVVAPLVLGFGLGAFGILGLVGSWGALIALRALLTEVRIRDLPAGTKSFVRSQRWHRFRPARLLETLRPRRTALVIANLVRRKLVGQVIGFWIVVGVVFLCGFAAGRGVV